MGKNKLKKFAEMEELPNVLQFPWCVLQQEGFPLRGNWREEFFRNSNPIVLELGCGKGEYTVGLAKANPDINYIGIDIKGARMWKGAREAHEAGMQNVAFLRTDIELIESFFAPGEVDEIWITFPDPQMQKQRKRLTSSRFLSLYQKILRHNGVVSLKCDSPFLYEYTTRLVSSNALETIVASDDIYGAGLADAATAIKTFYEQQWLARGKKIKLLRFRLPAEKVLEDINDKEIARDDYHSAARHTNFN